ncbi:hypothetical protein [Brevibacterium aurantiacum]|uniref:Uncharacterized protein n=1 Tax=Brevibacterium aurantiacum TaxID=273384 RepID=A0A556C5D8_BREAU|nr:hypothetical protein [Brevibacterium aurantiacum]TSI12652.1 hypothetical protein FO013_19455 [Brevibacterium aurantiacum]
MAREYAKLLTRIWANGDFKALRASDQRLYFQLISQPDISMCGVVTLAEKRWSLQVADQDEGQISDCLASLESSRFVVVDRGTQEVLVRSYIRSDEAWKSPTTMKGIDSSVRAVLSESLKAVLRDELIRIDTSKLSVRVSEKTGQSTKDYVEGVIRVIADDFKALSQAPTEGACQGASDTPTQGHKRNLHTTEPEPAPTPATAPAPETSSCRQSQATDDEPRLRPDVDDLLDLLDAEIEANGNKIPTRTKRNHDDMRLLIDRDQYTTDQIRYVIGWCQHDNFWKANILSPKKLREKFPQLVARIKAEQERPSERGQARNRADERGDQSRAVIENLRRMEEQHTQAIQGELL